MPVPVPVPGTEPFTHDGGRIGVVMSHGFTGSPFSMRPWAQHLAEAGYSVRLPLLPGHGTSWQDCNTSTWQQWYATVEDAFGQLAARCELVFAAGLSMGGTLVTRLAELAGDRVAGLIVVNPSYLTTRRDAKFAPLAKHVLKSQKSIGSDIKDPSVTTEGGYDRTPVVAFAELQKLWKQVRPRLGSITAPVLLFNSVDDHVVEPVNGQLLIEQARGTTVRQVMLPNSYHVATLDFDKQVIFERSVQFINQIAAQRAAGAGQPGAQPSGQVGDAPPARGFAGDPAPDVAP